MAEKLYFAYGSNINLKQMAYRCPDAHMVSPIILENYELLFRGNTRAVSYTHLYHKEIHLKRRTKLC